MIYIQAIESITHQNSFQQENLWDVIQSLNENSEVISPDYKKYILPASLRRLSPVLRMALTAAKECQLKVEKKIDSISVGTALGCLVDTEKFLVTFHNSVSDTISPTAFIQSTHNTIAGQISLDLKNHSYNMTHTQNSLSFEAALLDATMCCKEGKSTVLLGAADEAINFLKHLQPEVIKSELALTSGSTFLIVGSLKTYEGIGIMDCEMNFHAEKIDQSIDSFVTKNGIILEDIDQILVSGKELCEKFFGAIDYLQFTGFYLSASAFAVHMGYDWLRKEKKKFVLIVNQLEKQKLGLILLKRDETLS